MTPTQSPWEQFMETLVEIKPPTPEQIARWQAEDEYLAKTKEYGDE